MRRAPGGLIRDIQAQMVADPTAGVRKIADAIGATYSNVQLCIARMRKASDPVVAARDAVYFAQTRQRVAKHDPAVVAMIASLRESRHSMAVIGKQLGISPRTIQTMVVRRIIPPLEGRSIVVARDHVRSGRRVTRDPLPPTPRVRILQVDGKLGSGGKRQRKRDIARLVRARAAQP